MHAPDAPALTLTLLAVLAVLLLSVRRTFYAQEPSALKAEQAVPEPKAAAPQTAPPPVAPLPQNPKEGRERILRIIPAFMVTDLRHAPTLCPQQKFKLFARQSFDPFQWVAAGARAGYSQAENSLPGYGQGAQGYAKRYGTSFADVTDHLFLSNFVFPVMLKQDPRYFRLGQGTIKHRILYAMAQEFWCRTDKGNGQFNFSKVLGAFAASAVSNAYYPSTDRGFGLTMRRSGTSILSGMATGLANEFWPDIDCKVFHRCNKW